MALYGSNTENATGGRRRPDRPEWTAAKGVGDAGEQLVAQVLRSIGLLVQRIPGDASHDLNVTGAIEVKNDLKAANSGNLAVEISHCGRPSGIVTSAASGWAFVAGAELLLTTTAALRNLIGAGHYPRVPAGENAIVALVPLDHVRRISRRLIWGGTT